MWRTLLVLGLMMAGHIHAEGVVRRFEQPLEFTGWSIFPHRNADGNDQIVAINRESLKLQVLSQKDGSLLEQDRLESQLRRPHLLQTLSASNGEFLIALASRTGTVELHGLGDEGSYPLNTKGMPVSLSLMERRPGFIYLAVASTNEVEIYERDKDGEMVRVRRMGSPKAIIQARLLKAANGDLAMQIFTTDKKVVIYQFNPEQTDSVERMNLPPRKWANVVDSVIYEGQDAIIAQMTGSRVSFFIESKNENSLALPADMNLGTNGWLKSQDGRWRFATLQREGEATRVNIYDPYMLDQPVRLSAGDASLVTDIGLFIFNRREHYFFVKNRTELVIQDANRVIPIPNASQMPITSVQIMRGGLAVTLEDANSTRLVMVGLTSPLQTADSSLKSKRGNNPKSR